MNALTDWYIDNYRLGSIHTSMFKGENREKSPKDIK
jgi:hypothetical protein